MNDNELMHYGVLGMKWGRRKARPTNNVQRTRAAYRKSIKANQKAANKSDARELYSKTKKYELRESLGKKVAKNILLSPAGATTYNMARAMNHSQASSLVRAMFDISVSNLVGTTAGAATNYGYMKATGKNPGALGTAASYGTAYGVDRMYRNSGNMGSLQQRRLLKEYQSRRH